MTGSEDIERALVISAIEGNREDFGRLVGLYQARLRAFTARYITNSDDVYDVVQDAFLDAYRALGRFDTEREFGPWMRTVCRNRVLKFLRDTTTQTRRHEQVVREELIRRAEMDGETAADACERMDALRECMGKLAPEQRELLTSRYAAREAVKDIAQSQNRSAASVSMLLMRLRETLMGCIEKTLGGSSA